MSDDDQFAARLRADLQAAAAEVQPDPAGWRALDVRIRRRRTAAQGGMAVAAVAVALVAVVVLPRGGDQRVELAPGAVASSGPPATQPEGFGESVRATAGTGSGVPGTVASTPGGIVYSDGDSIHVVDLDGQTLWTPAQGEGTSTITDLAVLPGGTVPDFTMAYRFDVTADDAICGDISWSRVVGEGNDVAGGALPGVSISDSGECLGAPVFASDGSALAWLAEGADGGWLLQTLDWSPQGPVGALVSFPVNLVGLDAPVAVQWEIAPDGGDTEGSGALSFRATDAEGTRLFTIPTVRTADGALTLPPVAPDPTVLRTTLGLARLVDTDGAWLVGISGTGAPQRPTIRVTRTITTGGPSGPGVTGSVPELTYAEGDPLFVDAIDDDALLLGTGGPMRLLTVGSAPDSRVPAPSLSSTSLPMATSGALLQGDATATPSAAPPADGPAPTAPPSAGPTPDPTPFPGLTPESTGVDSSDPTMPSPSPTASAGASPAPTGNDLPVAVQETADAARAAAQAGDYDALAALLPTEGPFTSNFGGEADHIAFYRMEEANGIDVLGTLAGLLAGAPTEDDGGIFVWPRDYLQDGYLGYRVGITETGRWIFYVAGD